MKDVASRLYGVAAAATALGALASPELRRLLEARMSLHMGLQLPALAACGALMLWPWRGGLARRASRFNQQGVPGFLFVLCVMSMWMLPRSLDAVLADGRLNVLKFASVVAAGAVALMSWRVSSLITQSFVVGNCAWMLCVAGLVVQDSRARLCTAYLLEDQVAAGRCLIAWGLWLALAWMLWAWRVQIRLSRRPLSSSFNLNHGRPS